MTTVTFKTKLSEAQKDVLDRAANRARVIIILNQNRNENEVWNAITLSDEHKGTLSALYTKGLVTLDDHLTGHGILTAKEIFAETCMDAEGGDWDGYMAKKLAEKREYQDQQELDRLSWKAVAEKLPVPEGFELRDYGRLSVEWQPTEFARMPGIKIEDKNAPYWGHQRHHLPEWTLQCSGVNAMDIETVELYQKGMEVAVGILRSWEEQYKDVEVHCLRHRFNAVTEGDAETAKLVCVYCGAEEDPA